MLVLAVGAHPDDETFGGGLLAKYASEGHEVRIVLTTRGEGGSPGEPPLCERSELGATREAEARESGRILGAREVRFLPFRDPDLVRGRLQPIDASLDEFSAAIAAEIAVARPDVVVTHGSGGEYGHPQHTYTHRAVFAALASCSPGVRERCGLGARPTPTPSTSGTSTTTIRPTWCSISLPGLRRRSQHLRPIARSS